MGKILKPVPADKQKSLGKLPQPVRNKMGFQKDGGKLKKQAAIAIAMKAAGKKPKKARGGASLSPTAANVSKRLGSRLKAGGTLSPTASSVSRRLASPFKNKKAKGGATLTPGATSTSNRLASNLKLKKGGKLKMGGKCRGGCY